MIINWPLIIVLFCLSLPGIFIVIPRLMHFLLPENTIELKKRFSRFAILQSLFMVLVMSFTGAVLSLKTGLTAPLLEALLLGKASFESLQNILLPTFLYTLLGLVVFCCLYYGLVISILDEHSVQVMAKLRNAIGLDGLMLYGVVEEVIGRWGLMNLIAFFLMLMVQKVNGTVIFLSILISGLIFSVGQIPAYLAAGCVSSRRLLYSLIALSLWQSIIFGILFWQYGIISAIVAHMLFHFGWNRYDKI